jgi:integrase
MLCLSSALALAVKDGTIARNPADDVELPKVRPTERATWTASELSTFLDSVAEDRLVGLWHLTALGMRRGEVLGARWSDVDWGRKVLRIRQSRVLVGSETIAGTPKSDRSRRDVPLHEDALRALKATRERTTVRGAVIPLRGAGDRLIGVTETGEPVDPTAYGRRFQDLAADAGLDRIRLHDVRHSVATILLEAGQPVHVVARVLGHDPAVLMAVYAHVSDRSAGAAMDALRSALGNR